MEQIRKESLAAELLAILYIQKKPFQLTFWIIFLCFIAYAILAPNRYLAEGTFLVKAKNVERSVSALEGSYYGGAPEIKEEDVYTEAETLSSKAVLTKTATRIIEKKLIDIQSSSGLKAKNEQEIVDDFAKQIGLALTIDVLPKTKIVHPVILWRNPKDAAIILNTLMWAYLEHRDDVQNSEESKDFLSNQVDSYLSEWRNKKSAIVGLAEKYNAPDPNLELTNNLLLKKDYVAAINELEQKRDTLKSDVDMLEKTLSDNQNHLYSFLSNDVITELVKSLHDSQKEKEEAEKIFLSKRVEVKDADEVFQNSYKTIRGEAVSLLQHQQVSLKTTNETLISLTDKLKKLEQRNIELKKVSVQMEQLQMESVLMASSFDVFYKRRDQSQLKGTLQANVAIMSQAKAEPEPAKPARVQLVLLGLFLAMTLSLIVAFILDAIDQTIKTPRDVENYLRSPVIFSIEQIKKES
jgi:uncharacterized protein involved in exopolysaccharide biosynthesis